MDPLGLNQDLTPFDAQVYANKVIDNPDGLFNYTEDLIHQFNVEGYIQGSGTDSTLFTFPYDWRYGASGLINSTTTNTDLLKQKIQDIMAQTGSDKVDVIAHSTGGLLVKKYVLENPTSHHINKAVLVGVPNLGSPKAYKALINGDNFGVTGLEDAEMKKIAQNMPIVYDLAPSQEYYNQAGSFFQIHNPFGALGQIDTDLDYAGTIQELNNKKLINSQAQINSQNLHTAEFDNYDMRNNGVDLYNIVGCKSATFGKFTEVVQKFSAPSYDFPKTTTGDGTVPLLSAQTVPADPNKVFFVPKADHGKMPSQDGIRQQIVNLISGSSLSTNGKILEHDAVQNNPGLCQIKGEQIKIKSPVSINITDQNGNISGLAEDGSIQNEIPGADFEIWGEHKYVFLPTDEGQTYTINLKGTGAGTFTLDDESIVGDQTIQTQVFSNLPVTTDLTGQVNLGTTTTLTLDNNGDGTNDATVSPSSILNAAQSQDLTAPVSASTISGLMGQIGYYRTNAAITLSAIDPDVNEDPSQTSGVLSIWYKLDGDATYRTYNNPISVAVEGVHSLKFFSTDKAGNNEIEQSVSFTIDKTAPTITLTSPVAGGQYLVNQSAAANFACADALSGIQTCQGSVGNGSNIDTSSSGNKTFTVIATDLAGNQNSQSVNYSVYKFSSLFSPITSDSKTFKKNTTVPVKFQLTDGNSHFYGLPTARLFLDPIGSTNGTPAVSNSAGNTGNIFKYDPIMQQYVFNLSTSMGLFTSGSSHTLRVVIDGDPLPHDQVNAIKIK
jgi:pimeloyl-ACP methyl ester carboxylesterase